jgi:nucleoid-associated protein YgaU
MAILNKFEISYKDSSDVKQDFMFQYNPNKVDIVKEVEWAGVDGNQKDVNEIQFASGKAKTLNITDVLFDTTMTGNQSVYTKFIHNLEFMTLVQEYTTSSGKKVKRPPYLTLSWGSSTYFFECILKKLSYDFTMFDRLGVPIRANVSMEFEEIVPETEVTNTLVAQKVKTYTPGSGETLYEIAESQLGDTSKWKLIATMNGVDNPFVVEAGKALTLPDE